MTDLVKCTVTGVNDESGQIVMHHVLAESLTAAFVLVAKVSELELVSSQAGWINEGDGIVFPGPNTVCSTTVLEQPEVFGKADDFYIDEDFTPDPYWVKSGEVSGDGEEAAYLEAGGIKAA